MAKKIHAEIRPIPEDHQYREPSMGVGLTHAVEMVFEGKVVPLAQSPNLEKAEIVAAALNRWAEQDPEWLDAVVWNARDHGR